jgi:hypothetical protein
MAQQQERDFLLGHPAAADYVPGSPESNEWARVNVSPLGQRDFPVDHPKAVDTAGNLNTLEWEAGVDPHNPHREAHTGRTPEQAAGVAALSEAASKAAKESPVMQPVDASAVNAALDVKRAEVGRDILTAGEYSEVMAAIQAAPRDPQSEEDVRAKVELQHQALNRLLSRGYTQRSAMEVIAREGAAKVLGIESGAAG